MKPERFDIFFFRIDRYLVHLTAVTLGLLFVVMKEGIQLLLLLQ